MQKGGIFWFIIYLVFGIYFINSSFNFIKIPEIISNFDSWIILLGGVLILLGGVNHFRAIRNKNKYLTS
jgi:predicted membrane channel-forming protein YqfA (hemolysin III family)